MELGADSGGTFTDVVADDGRVLKVSSTPDDPALAVRTGVDGLAATTAADVLVPDVLVHGTTVATNALLQRRGATVALVTTKGFADLIEIARQDRPSIFDHHVDRPEPLVAREHRFEVDERIGSGGEVLRALDLDSLPEMDDEVESVAISLLHSIVAPDHERQVAVALRKDGFDVSVSSEVAPEFREYERTVTTVLNAYLRPLTRRYVAQLPALATRVLVMTSSGGTVPVDVAAESPVQLLLSGPAGGVAAAAAAAVAHGFGDAVTFDMGGTSSDVCLVIDGRPAPAAQRTVAGLPVRVPSLDIHTVGAGGGSIAWLDNGDALRVGPISAGADPGPACFGRGGERPTVTDADVVLGRIPADAALGDLPALDVAAAEAALERVGVRAEDVVRVVDVEMTQALRLVTVERGVDPASLVLVAFGGAGPLHACGVADELGIATVLVPARAGVLSAVGLLEAPLSRELVVAWPGGADLAGLDEALDALGSVAVRHVVRMLGDGVSGDSVEVEVAVDARYLGQGHELTVASVEEFDEVHERRNGYARGGHPVEVIALRARAGARRGIELPPTSCPIDGSVDGPASIVMADCTTFVAPGWRARPGLGGAVLLVRNGADAS